MLRMKWKRLGSELVANMPYARFMIQKNERYVELKSHIIVAHVPEIGAENVYINKEPIQDTVKAKKKARELYYCYVLQYFGNNSLSAK